MHPLVARVRRAIRRHALIEPGDLVAVALSGGADSVALASALVELDAIGDLGLAGFAHLNHQLRGTRADEDEQFCRGLAARLSRPIVVEAIDVGAMARAERRSIEDAARSARYAFFDRAAAGLGASRVAVAHTRDDQAETVVLRLLRGAGPDGLAGIHRRRGIVVRPLLDVPRTEVLDYLREQKLDYREDETNRDVAMLRNRVRHELMPLLEQRFSMQSATLLARAAAVAADDARFFADVVDRRASLLMTVEPGRVALDAAALAAEPPSIGSRLAHRALRHVAGGRFVGFDQIDRLLAMALGEEPARADCPGGWMERIGGQVVLTSRTAAPAAVPPRWNKFHYALSIPGEVVVTEAGCAIEADLVPGEDPAAGPSRRAGRGPVAVIDAAGLPDTLGVRGRRPGDVFRPLGLNGQKKLQDFFVDRKVPRGGRDRVPIVVDADDRIIWVAGHALAEEFRVTDRTQSMVILRLRDLGGRA